MKRMAVIVYVRRGEPKKSRERERGIQRGEVENSHVKRDVRKVGRFAEIMSWQGIKLKGREILKRVQ